MQLPQEPFRHPGLLELVFEARTSLGYTASRGKQGCLPARPLRKPAHKRSMHVYIRIQITVHSARSSAKAMCPCKETTPNTP